MKALTSKQRCLLDVQQSAVKKINKKIAVVLSKYDPNWVSNEELVSSAMMRGSDYSLYSMLFDVREDLKSIQTQVISF